MTLTTAKDFLRKSSPSQITTQEYLKCDAQRMGEKKPSSEPDDRIASMPFRKVFPPAPLRLFFWAVWPLAEVIWFFPRES